MAKLSKWDKRHLAMAQMVATWSKDPRTKVGCVLVGADPRDITFGYNGFPPGIADTKERLADRETKNMLTQHAERNALDNARFDTRGGTIVTTRYPCHECAKSMVVKGIGTLITPRPPTDPVWSQSSHVASMLFHEKNILVVYYETPEEEHERAIKEGLITGADQDGGD